MNKQQILKLLNFYEQFSNCPKKKVAAVLLSDETIQSITDEFIEVNIANKNIMRLLNRGVNFRVLPHSEATCDLCIDGYKEAQCPAIHAEADCLLGESFRDTYKHTFLISYSPCPECCKLIRAAGISRVIIKEPRLKTPPIIDCVNYKVDNYDELSKKLLYNVDYIRLWEMSEDWQV